MFDVVLAGGRVVDGTGSPWFRADVGVRGDRIAAVGALGRAETRRRLDVSDRVVAPGFVDTHVHADLALLADPLHEAADPAGRHHVPPGPGRRRHGAGLAGHARVHAALHGGVQRALRGAGPLVEHGGVSRPLRPPGGGERRVPHPERERPHGRDGARDAAPDVRRARAHAPHRPPGDGGGRGRPVERARLHPEPLRAGRGARGALPGDRALRRRLRHPHARLLARHGHRRDGRGLPDRARGRASPRSSRTSTAGPTSCCRTSTGRAARGSTWPSTSTAIWPARRILGMVALPPWVQEGGADATLARLGDPAVRARLRAEGFAGPRGAARRGAAQLRRGAGLPSATRA